MWLPSPCVAIKVLPPATPCRVADDSYRNWQVCGGGREGGSWGSTEIVMASLPGLILIVVVVDRDG